MVRSAETEWSEAKLTRIIYQLQVLRRSPEFANLRRLYQAKTQVTLKLDGVTAGVLADVLREVDVEPLYLDYENGRMIP